MVNVDADICRCIKLVPMVLASGIVFVSTSFDPDTAPFAAIHGSPDWLCPAFILALLTLIVLNAARETFPRLYGALTEAGHGLATSMTPSRAETRRRPAQQ
jgi:hypothetical protein